MHNCREEENLHGDDKSERCRFCDVHISINRSIYMDVQVGDVLKLKKNHPCGSCEWEVLRIGADFRLKCRGCGHQVMVPRTKIEKNIREIIR